MKVSSVKILFIYNRSNDNEGTVKRKTTINIEKTLVATASRGIRESVSKRWGENAITKGLRKISVTCYSKQSERLRDRRNCVGVVRKREYLRSRKH